MAELDSCWSRCVTGDCRTDVQGGTDGMLRHLQVVHFSGLTTEELEERFEEQLWPEIAGRADG